MIVSMQFMKSGNVKEFIKGSFASDLEEWMPEEEEEFAPTEERLAITIEAILGFYPTGDAERDRQSAAVIAKALLDELDIERIEREAFNLGWKAAGGVIIDDKEVPDEQRGYQQQHGDGRI